MIQRSDLVSVKNCNSQDELLKTDLDGMKSIIKTIQKKQLKIDYVKRIIDY